MASTRRDCWWGTASWQHLWKYSPPTHSPPSKSLSMSKRSYCCSSAILALLGRAQWALCTAVWAGSISMQHFQAINFKQHCMQGSYLANQQGQPWPPCSPSLPAGGGQRSATAKLLSLIALVSCCLSGEKTSLSLRSVPILLYLLCLQSPGPSMAKALEAVKGFFKKLPLKAPWEVRPCTYHSHPTPVCWMA